ncbi:DUF2164 domain-containing protein [Vibrio intestinalis]|uniref:DUF2164 domain-containing protein n=1 Tax=Vibrio intestinalis TaxID=2933291 RepID=UPI0021A76EFA|nr:DUF2164 domain-containing protein [Vibrio intestinalis]
MSKIEFTSQQKQKMAEALQEYLADELDTELGQFDAQFLLDFVIAKFAPVFYNKGLADAQEIVERKVLDIADEIFQIEQMDEFER